MGGLRKFVDKIKPTFSEGGKLSFLASTFDAFETFLFVPNTTTSRGAHIRDCNDMKRTMIVVVVALMPALLFGMYNTGYQVGMTGWAAFWFGFLEVLPMIVVSYVVGLGIEFFFAQKRGHEVNEGFLVSGLLIPMIMPVGTPLWMIALGTAFAVIFGKEVFGGTGMNVFNPALVARAFVFFAYTPFISGEKVWFADDAVSGATALEQLATSGAMSYSTADAFLGFIPGCVGETSTLAILIGAAILLFTGVASWRTMSFVFIGGLAMGYFFQALGVTTYPAWEHLIVGGFAFGAVFMATDPVTGPSTTKGQLLYGALTGVLIGLFRVRGNAADSTTYAVLLANMFGNLIDELFIPVPYGFRIPKEFKKAIPKPVIILVVITLIAGLALSAVFATTEQTIAENQERARRAAYQAVLPEAEDFVPCTLEAGDGVYGSVSVETVLAGVDGSGETVGYAIGVHNSKSYDGGLTVVVGILPDGTVTGIYFTELHETPGMGMRCGQAEFMDQFKNVSTQSFALRGVSASTEPGIIDGVSSATISSSAVVDAVNGALRCFAENLG